MERPDLLIKISMLTSEERHSSNIKVFLALLGSPFRTSESPRTPLWEPAA